MQFTTTTDIQPLAPRIGHDARLLVIGSCFAEHIGSRLARMKWRTEVNPFGVLYNPFSIAEALTMLMDRHSYTGDELAEMPDGGWNTWLHHSRFSHPDKAEALATINRRMMAAAEMLAEAQWLVVTLGTAWVYRLKATGCVVGNCHKVPEREFVRQRLSVEEIVEAYTALLARLRELNPRVNVLFTVSPVRHLKDGLHGNQLSKSTLLLAVDELCRRLPDVCHYFPAYEIVTDELRDYRFYAEDMAHPSQQAVGYVWERFVEHCTDAQAQAFITEWERVCRALEHRPFQPDSEKYRDFVRQNLLKIMALKVKFPYLEAQNEIDICHTLLKTSLG